jgi:acetylornithine deacetylase/succinyl-diaminopimelate desuccinylase-like protein
VSKIVAEIPVFEGAEGDADFSRTQDGLRNALARREKVSISLRVCEGAAPRQQLLEKLGALVQEMAGEETPLEFEIVGSCEGAALLTPVTEKVVAGVRISTM